MRRALSVFGLATIAVIALACSSDDSSEPSATAIPDPIANYEAALVEIVTRVNEASDELTEPLVEAFQTGSTFTVIARLLDLVPQDIAIQEGGIADVGALDAPPEYEVDQERFIEAQRAAISIYERMVSAADADDIVQIEALFIELTASNRAMVNALSPEFLQLVAVDDETALFVSLNSRLSSEEAAYVDALQDGVNEFVVRAGAFRRAAQATYPNAERLMVALGEAGAGEAMAAAYAVIGEIEPPESLVADHALVIAFYEEAVRIDRLIGEAARSGDAATFLILDAELQRNAELVAFDVRSAVCNVLVNPNLCAGAVDVPDGEYERDLRFAMRELLVRSADWNSFRLLPAGSDDTIVAAAAQLAPLAIEPLEEAQAIVLALVPPSELEADHAVVLSFLEEMLAQQEAILAAALNDDADGVRAGIAATETATCEASSGLSEAARPAVGFMFGPGSLPAVACTQ